MACVVDTSSGPEPAAAADDYRRALSEAVCDAAELARALELPPGLVSAEAAARFPLLVPRPFLARCRKGDPDDPLVRQILPRAEELAEAAGFSRDPLGEAALANPPGLLWKYQRRSLMVTTPACCVHCRFCFRRHFSFPNTTHAGDIWEGCLAKIASEPSIEEVILSGGDPLTLDDDRLAELVTRLAAISHVQRVRVHTRLPVMIPARVTQRLLDALCGTRLPAVVVVHVNHAAEIDGAVAAAFEMLHRAGVLLLSQTVLLLGVNNSVGVLDALFRRLVQVRVVPYYIHQLDRVAGAAHFETRPETGMELIARLRARLPGYAVPRYVREMPQGDSKEVLA